MLLLLASTVGGVSITGKNSTFSMETAGDIALTANTATTDNIAITNTQGTAATAIELEASAGGVSIAADGDIASAIKLHATAGTSQTVDIVNTAGTTDGSQTGAGVAGGAVNISSTAGGIGLSWNDAKDLWAEGGRAVILTKFL